MLVRLKGIEKENLQRKCNSFVRNIPMSMGVDKGRRKSKDILMEWRAQSSLDPLH